MCFFPSFLSVCNCVSLRSIYVKFSFLFFSYFSYVFIRVSVYKNVIHNKRKIHENTKKNPVGIELFSYVKTLFCFNKLAQMLATWVKTQNTVECEHRLYHIHRLPYKSSRPVTFKRHHSISNFSYFNAISIFYWQFSGKYSKYYNSILFY